MNLTALLTQLFKKDTPDEEERADSPSQDTEKVASTSRVTAQSHASGVAHEDDGDLEHDDHKEYADSLLAVDLDDQPDDKLSGPRRVLFRIWSSVFPSPSDEEEIQAYIPNYRILPILSGIAIPFCILLDIPGVTADWYIRMEGSTVVASKPNPPLLDIGIGLSLLCAVLANLCLVIRFLEKRIKTMTILCTVFLSIHDIINIAALAAFGATRDDSDYTFGQAFWMTLCSTIVSMFTNVTLIIDLIQTSDFKRSGSGLTRRQRSLVIIIIGLFFYVALGALIYSLLLDLTFINGLYFTVVTIETIGFGDIVPKSASSRVFTGFYATLGVINLAFVVGYVRETVLEGLDFGYRRRLLEIQERRRAARRRKRVEKRWRHAIIWRLREQQVLVWIPKKTNDGMSVWSIVTSYFWRVVRGIRSTTRRNTHWGRGRHGKQLNLWALPPCQLEAAALEAGASLDTLLPAGFYETYDQDPCHHGATVKHRALPSWFVVHPVYHRREQATDPLTHRRLGAMAAILTKLSFAVYESGGSPLPSGHGVPDTSSASGSGAAQDSFGSLQTSFSEDEREYHKDVRENEKKAYYIRSGLSWVWFLLFWMGGAAVFRATEGWSYGTSMYFCFIAFTTIGYGDLTPTTPAGRSIFVVWALIGVATMTTFISVVSEAYTSRYKGILGRNSFKHVVRRYRERNKVELREKVQRMGTSTGVKLVLQDAIEREEADVVESELPPTGITAGDGVTLTPSSSKPSPQVQQAQKSLQKFPKLILTETRSIQRYMQLIGDRDGHSPGAEKLVDLEAVHSLIDDVMGGKRLPETTKDDILKDGESRQMLMLLGIERSLNELLGISERAIAAVQERDRVVATLERDRDQDNADVTA